MPERLIRTFIAIDVPEAVRETSVSLQTLVKAKPKVVKWVRPENIHLTLRFIGPTAPGEVEKINTLLGGVAGEYNDLSLTISGTGCFPKKARPRVLWLGVEGDVPELKSIVSRMGEGMEKLGYPLEERNYSPHITVGRIRYPQKATPDVTDFLAVDYEAISFAATRINLYQSDLLPSGPIYSLLGAHDLRPE